MHTFTVLACLALTVPLALGTTVGEHTTGAGFCYREEEGCGPSSIFWDGQCHTGLRQSRINLPLVNLPFGGFPIKLSVYQGLHFRMQNNGHSVQIDFDNQGPSTQVLIFPDPLQVHDPFPTLRGYRFAAAHFHWGVSDTATGSEHCVGSKCSAMELHLVHYLANYPTMADALASGDVNALTVIGLLIDVHDIRSLGNGVLNRIVNNPINDAITLGPITRNLLRVTNADHDSSKWTTVYEPLDFSKMLFSADTAGVYTYRGSLTTPGCNEQVNWYVLKKPATTSHDDLQAFRTIVKDEGGIPLTENHRPLQPVNGRRVLLSGVIGL